MNADCSGMLMNECSSRSQDREERFTVLIQRSLQEFGSLITNQFPNFQVRFKQQLHNEREREKKKKKSEGIEQYEDSGRPPWMPGPLPCTTGMAQTVEVEHSPHSTAVKEEEKKMRWEQRI